MSLDLFRKITSLLPEPVFLIASDTRVLMANPAAWRLIPELERRPRLSEIVSEGEVETTGLVRQWLRTGHPTPGGLTLHGQNGARLQARCFGARATWLEGHEPAVHMRAVPLGPGDRFYYLRAQFSALERERVLQMKVQELMAELAAAKAERDALAAELERNMSR